MDNFKRSEIYEIGCNKYDQQHVSQIKQDR